jgi:hypothetical protein
VSDARRRVAAIVAGYRPPAYRLLSHADVIVGRLLQGYGVDRGPIRRSGRT